MLIEICQTGPKGVVEDWRRFKQLEVEKREEQSKEKADLAKRLTLTCRSQVSWFNTVIAVIWFLHTVSQFLKMCCFIFHYNSVVSLFIFYNYSAYC